MQHSLIRALNQIVCIYYAEISGYLNTIKLQLVRVN